MPANKEALIRYRIIDACLRNPRHKYPSLQDLVEACEDKLGKEFSGSTIQKDIYAMRYDEALGFKAPIEYSKAGKGYSYTDSNFTLASVPLNDQDIEAIEFAASILQQFKGVKLMEQFDSSINKIFDAVNIHRILGDDPADQFIQLEKAPYFKGSELLGTIVKAIKNRQTLQFDYQPFDTESPKTHIIHPYLLKEYRNRWYLIGMIDTYDLISTFGLDRIQNIATTDTKFRFNISFEPETYFRHAYGITTFKGEPEKVILSFTPKQGKYIKTQPLHGTQQILLETDSEVRIQLDVGITIELIMQILSFGDQVKVLEPAALIDRIKKVLQNSLQNYS